MSRSTLTERSPSLSGMSGSEKKGNILKYQMQSTAI